MRICGGTFGGRKLSTPSGNQTRPTSDKVRQALFNMLESRGLVDDAIVIDAFCGTGALGLEALSRGANFCTFFDKDRLSLDVCKQNIDMLSVQAQTKAQCQDATKLRHNSAGQAQATLIFLDPPYNLGLVSQAIDALEAGDWASPEAVYVIESEASFVLDVPSLSLVQEKTYKRTKIMIVQKSSS